MRNKRLFRYIGKRWIINLNIQFEPRDLWIGVFWRISEVGLFHLYLCIIPVLPFHLTIAKLENGHLTKINSD